MEQRAAVGARGAVGVQVVRRAEDRVARVADVPAEAVGAPRGGHELHRPARARGALVAQPAEAGLDEVDRREHVPADAEAPLGGGVVRAQPVRGLGRRRRGSSGGGCPRAGSRSARGGRAACRAPRRPRRRGGRARTRSPSRRAGRDPAVDPLLVEREQRHRLGRRARPPGRRRGASARSRTAAPGVVPARASASAAGSRGSGASGRGSGARATAPARRGRAARAPVAAAAAGRGRRAASRMATAARGVTMPGLPVLCAPMTTVREATFEMLRAPRHDHGVRQPRLDRAAVPRRLPRGLPLRARASTRAWRSGSPTATRRRAAGPRSSTSTPRPASATRWARSSTRRPTSRRS